MSEDILPEELIQEILSQSILADPESFLDPANHRAFLSQSDAPSNPLRSAHLLHVSKRWARIGTPLMYSSLWLSKPAHTATVLRLFRADPSLGTRVRDLRLEQGFGPELAELVQLMPNVRNMSIAWNLAESDDIAGLLLALPSLSPKKLYLGPHVIVDRFARRDNDQLAGLVDRCIAEVWKDLVRDNELCWFPLVTYICAIQTAIHMSYWYGITRSCTEALRKAPSLAEISVHVEDVYRWSWSVDLLAFLDNETLKTVFCRSDEDAATASKSILKKGVAKRIVDRMTFMWHASEYGS